MAVTVIQSPTTPNVTGTNLVYALSSSLVGSPQYRYVTDIYESGSNNYITTIKTYPNIYGSGIVDVANELNDQLGYDKYWKVTGSIDPVESAKTFNLKFGEEYGTSISSSRTTYTGSSDNYLQVFPGTLDSSNPGYNFNTSSFAGPGNPWLTNNPGAQTTTAFPDSLYGYLVNSTDYLTLTHFPVDPNGYITVNSIKVENGNTSAPLSFNINFGINSGSFETVGLGPQNLAELNPTFSSSLASGDINVIYTTNDYGGVVIYINDLWDGILASGGNASNPTLLQKQCSDEYTRFAFINQYGFWDYYNVYNPLRRNTQVKREIYSKTRVTYDEPTSVFRTSNRGDEQYLTAYDDIFDITTDFIDENMSQWLTELFDSPDVYIQSGSNFVPINISNVNYITNLDTSRNKLFQYTIEFKHSNQRETR